MATKAPEQELRAFRLEEKGLALLDQRALPERTEWLWLEDVEGVAQAIETLAVRGAPAIGGAAAAGIVLAARRVKTLEQFEAALRIADARLRKTRPTAVNLFHALDRMRFATAKALSSSLPLDKVIAALETECRRFLEEDEAMCTAMGAHGAPLFEDGDVVLTVCHTGALATCGQGTALGVLKTAHASGKRLSVLALETRPLLQGARLTAWECEQVGLPVRLITDGMAAFAL
ncbi:MAG: S-methyl-5-thioribose-1-phosphate isomerase, partial [Myxococcota bacterium]